MNAAQDVALFYVIPIALWIGLLLILIRVWWTSTLEDSLAYLVYLRERKALFITLLVGLAAVHMANESVKFANGFGWIGDSMTLAVGLAATFLGALILFLFAWFLLWRAPSQVQRPIVLDVPEHLAYSLGVLDRAERGRDAPESDRPE
jgi:hypothetical protein